MNRRIVLIDGRCIDEASSGVLKYCEALIKSYQKVYGYERVLVIRRRKDLTQTYRQIQYDKKTYSFVNFLSLYILIKRINPYIFHSPFHYGTFFKLHNCYYITTIHDLIYLTVPNFFSTNRIINKIGQLFTNFLIKKSLKNSDIIISISETTKADIINNFGYNSWVVPTGFVGKRTQASDELEFTSKVLKKFDIKSKDYFLYVGLTIGHKNIPFLIDCFNNSSTNKKLLICGKNIGNLSSNNPRIIFPGFVSDEELDILYKNCAAFVFPSIYEGFGIPILEALYHGCKVLSSSGGSLKEFSDKLITFFNPSDSKLLTELIESVDELPYPDNNTVQDYLALFDEEKCFNKLQAIISSTIDERE